MKMMDIVEALWCVSNKEKVLSFSGKLLYGNGRGSSLLGRGSSLLGRGSCPLGRGSYLIKQLIFPCKLRPGENDLSRLRDEKRGRNKSTEHTFV